MTQLTNIEKLTGFCLLTSATDKEIELYLQLTKPIEIFLSELSLDVYTQVFNEDTRETVFERIPRLVEKYKSKKDASIVRKSVSGYNQRKAKREALNHLRESHPMMKHITNYEKRND